MEEPAAKIEAPSLALQVQHAKFLVRVVAIGALFLAIVGGLHFYVGQRLATSTGLAKPWSTLIWNVVSMGVALLFMAALGGRAFPRSIARVLQWAGFVWLGLFGLTLSGLAISDGSLWGAGFFMPVDAGTHQIRSALVMALVLPSLVWGFRVARNPRVKKITVEIDALPEAFDGYRIVQLSDVHIGETLNRSFAANLTQQVNALAADVVAITGDLVDGSVNKLKDEVEPFSKLQAKDGVYFVTGNHEYYHGGASWEAECESLGMIVLHNDHRVIDRQGAKLVIAGVPDVEGSRFSADHTPNIDRTFAGTPLGAPRILLAHQPRFATSARNQKVDLMLSGHTHAGQMFPFMFFVKLQQPVLEGLKVIHGVPTYTSPGTGYWGPPFRIGTQGEITEITLRRLPSK